MCYCTLTYNGYLMLDFFLMKLSFNFVLSHKYQICAFLDILCHNVLKHSNNFINFDLQFWSTAIFTDTRLLLTQHRKHQKTEQYQRSADHADLDLDSDVNRPDSGKQQQLTTVPSQCGQFPYPWKWSFLY